MRNPGANPGVWPCDSSATIPEQAKLDLVLNQNQLLSWLVLSAVTETPASRRDRFWCRGHPGERLARRYGATAHS